MTNLSGDQLGLLKKVQMQKAEFDVREQELRAEFETSVLEARKDLENAVLVAFEAGVPKRRLHMEGLGTKDSKGLSDMLNGAVAHVLPGKKVVGVRKVDEVYIVTDSKGRDWEFWPVDLGDMTIIERSEQTPYSAQTAGLTPTPEVYTLLRKQFPKADMSDFLETGDDNE